MDKKPTILIAGEDGFNGDTGHFVISRDYGNAVAKAGGLPLCAFDVLSAGEYAAMADGLLLTGGPDIHCSWHGDYYKDRGEIPYFSRTRDDLDFALFREFWKAKKPIFGIGRGMLVINAALGGALYKDILRDTGNKHPFPDAAPSGFDGIHKAEFTSHPVKILPESRLFPAMGEKAMVNSGHHQGIKTLGRGLKASALAPDGTAEGIEHESLPCFGVLWHPERAAGGIPSDPRPFALFLSLCGEGKQ